MGADMLLYHCECPTSYTKAKPVVEYRIENIDDDTLDMIADELLFHEDCDAEEIDLEEDDLYNLDNLHAIQSRAMVRRRIKEAVDEIWHPRRDVVYLTLKDTLYMFSGGMSWGDEPSDACSLLSLLNCSGVFDGMGHSDFDYDSFKC
jgi:hypothetical protein